MLVLWLHFIVSQIGVIVLHCIAIHCNALHDIALNWIWFDFLRSNTAWEQTNIFAVKNMLCQWATEKWIWVQKKSPISPYTIFLIIFIDNRLNQMNCQHKNSSTQALFNKCRCSNGNRKKTFLPNGKVSMKNSTWIPDFFFFFPISFAFHRSTSSSSFLCQISRKYY